MQYRRSDIPGATYFFTVNLAQRNSDLLVRRISDLRSVIHEVKPRHPFSLVAMVVMPEHLHAIWRLPENDANYPRRWSLIKAGFSRRIERGERIAPSREAKRERGLWQRRFWEHQIRDQADLEGHVDYIHYNPVKHGWVERPIDWPHSTIHGYVARGWMDADWGGSDEPGGEAFGER